MKLKIKNVIYFIAIILGIYFLFTLYASHQYISSLVSANKIVPHQQLKQIIAYYMESSSPYLFYSVSLIGIGTILNELSLNMFQTDQSEEVVSDEMNNKENTPFLK